MSIGLHRTHLSQNARSFWNHQKPDHYSRFLGRLSPQAASLLVSLIDAVWLFTSASVLYIICLYSIIDDRYFGLYAVPVFIANNLLVAGLTVGGFYSLKKLLSVHNQVIAITVGWSTVVTAVILAGFLLRIQDNYSRDWVVTWYFIGLSGLLLQRFILCRWICRMWASGRLELFPTPLDRRVAGGFTSGGKFASLRFAASLSGWERCRALYRRT